MGKASLALLGVVACITLGYAAGKKEVVEISAAELKWTEVPETGGVQVAPLWGEMMKGAHGAMAKFPPGSTHPLHTHTPDLKVVVVSGGFTYGTEGGPEKVYGPGSYLMIPGGTKHTSGCAAGAPCLLFQEGSAKFDMKLVGAPAAKLPKK